MRKAFLCLIAVLAAALLVSATVYEGVTNVAFTKDLPWAYSIATNSFPPNTLVDVTNLENGKMVRVIVIYGLETKSLLATLSQNAADAINLRRDSTCKIRIARSSDNAPPRASESAQSRYQLGPINTGNVVAADEPAATDGIIADEPSVTNNVIAANDDIIADEPAVTGSVIAVIEPDVIEDNVIATNQPAATDNATRANTPAATDNVIAKNQPAVTDNAIRADASAVTDSVIAANEPDDRAIDVYDAGEQPAAAVAEQQPEPRIASGTLTLRPAEERIPLAQEQPAAASRGAAPGNAEPGNAAPNGAVPGNAASGDAHPVTRAAQPHPPAVFSPFQAPLISSLERGKWYVQIGVYARAGNVEDEISRIGMAYPVAIQNVGSDASPMFRVLLGPLNQGESGAMLQRFKSIGYADAFLRHN